LHKKKGVVSRHLCEPRCFRPNEKSTKSSQTLALRPVAQYLAEQGLHVTGVDSSPTMISLCRKRLPDQEWIVADMRQLALGRRFDGILASDSFFHLDYDDQHRMFAILRTMHPHKRR
jgi:trans-aconitate methyltransferase